MNTASPTPQAPSSSPDAMSPMLAEVAAGLSLPQKELSPKWFYDHRGSELFEEITQLPEYYPTRAERAMLVEHAPEWIAEVSPASLVELGAGGAEKTRVLLDAVVRASPGATYVPIDISSEFLENAAATLREEYPELKIQPVATDISRDLHLPPELPRPILFAFLGGTIGNFRPDNAVKLLRRIRAEMKEGDRFLLGADLEKDHDVLEAAYNDSAGVTAEFNLNVLTVLNRDLGADFDRDDFQHRAFYDRDKRRIEMHLVATRPVIVTIPGAGEFAFAEGESVRTEISRKFEHGSVVAMFTESGLAMERWVVGPEGFSLSTARRV